MGLILNKTIPMFIKGFPTVSDKYNVAGGTLAGTESVKFGDMVVFSTGTAGQGTYYKKPAASSITKSTMNTLAGLVLGTNVKLNETWAGDNVTVKPGEAFNLLVNGFIAVGLASGADDDDIVANANVYITANGELTTVSDSATVKDSSTPIPVPGLVFTGAYELQGSQLVAEILCK